MCEYSPDSMESKGSGYEGEVKGSAAESQRILRDYAPCIPVQDSPPEAGANYDPFEGPPAGPDDPLNQIPWSPRAIYGDLTMLLVVFRQVIKIQRFKAYNIHKNKLRALNKMLHMYAARVMSHDLYLIRGKHKAG